MQYDPIKTSLGRFFSGPLFMRKMFYFFLDVLLLRAWHIKKVLRKISMNFPDRTSVLDAGSGFGQYSWRMSRMNSEWEIRAIDIDRNHVEECRKFFEMTGLSERITCEYGDLTLLTDTDRYDFILSVDVMEHIKEDEAVFRNFHRSLKTDGMILISTPSDKGGSDVHCEGDHSFIDEHVRDGYGQDEIKEKLKKAGFKNIKVSYTYGKPGNLSWRLSMKYPIKMLNISNFFYLILPFYYILSFPFIMVLNFLDISFTHKSGTGLLVTAKS